MKGVLVILYMLDINTTKRQIKKYFIISIFVLIFGFIYEQFSHHVYSKYMMYAYLFPFLMGTFIYGIIYKTKVNDLLSMVGMNLYNASILTLTLGSIMEGVLEIYGTTNRLVSYYLIIGVVLLVLSLLIQIVNNLK